MSDQVRIPPWVGDLNSFRLWACSEEFPQHGWISFLKGKLLIDFSNEALSHNQMKGTYSSVLGLIVKESLLGHFLGPRMFLTNLRVLFSTEPDAIFVSNESLKSGKVIFERGDDSTEVLGSPDMVLEVVSKNSVTKDTEILGDLYWQAGISEYWLVDARGEELSFEILRHTASKYVTNKKQSGWVESAVFGKSFKLTRESNWHGVSEYNLLVR